VDNSELRRLIEASLPSPMLVPGTAGAGASRRPEEASVRKETLDGPTAAGI
jgi:hypothetical protein